MGDVSLSCSVRNEVGSNACNRIRTRGNIPGIIYGHNFENHSLEFDNAEFNKVVRRHGENAVVNVMIDDMTYPAMIKEIQRDPLTGEIIHIDLQQLVLTEKIHTSIPVLFSGKGRIGSDAILQQQLQKVDVECFPNNVPKNITIDVSNFKLGDVVRVSDCEFGEEVSVLNDMNEIIASLTFAKQIVSEEEDDSNVVLHVRETKSPNLDVTSE